MISQIYRATGKAEAVTETLVHELRTVPAQKGSKTKKKEVRVGGHLGLAPQALCDILICCRASLYGALHAILVFRLY